MLKIIFDDVLTAGRLSRGRYFIWVSVIAFQAPILLPLALLFRLFFDIPQNLMKVSLLSLLLIFFLFFLFLTLKRCRDVGLSTLISIFLIVLALLLNWLVMSKVLVIGVMFSFFATVILFSVIPGTKGSNQYGPDPLAPKDNSQLSV